MKISAFTFFLRTTSSSAINSTNKTLQAYLAACCRDAQTGGLLFSANYRFTSRAIIGNQIINAPAMPLNDAQFGGFFTFEVQP